MNNVHRLIKNLTIATLVIFLFDLAISLIIGVIYFLAVTNDMTTPKEEMPTSIWETTMTAMGYCSYLALGIFFMTLALHLNYFLKGEFPYNR